MKGGPVIELSDVTWEKTVEKSDLPVLVMFYSPTCPHCRTMEPYFRQYGQEFGGTVVFARINIAVNQWTAERFGVRSTPTFKMFCNGRPFQEMVGAVYPALIKRMVEEALTTGSECVRKSTEITYDITGYG